MADTGEKEYRIIDPQRVYTDSLRDGARQLEL